MPCHLAVDPAGEFVVSANYGSGSLAVHRIRVPWSAFPPGFGPRHLVLLPGDLVAAVGELTGEIALMTLDPLESGLTLRSRTAGTATARFSQPSGIVATPDGRFAARGSGVTLDGEVILDVPRQDRPDTRDANGRAGILLIGTGEYAALRERSGDHVTDGIAGETILLDAPAEATSAQWFELAVC